MCSFLSEPINERGNWWENESLVISNLLRVGVKNFCCPSKVVTKALGAKDSPEPHKRFFESGVWKFFLKAGYERNKKKLITASFLV